MALVCEALGVSRSGFYAWLARGPSARALLDEVTGREVCKSFFDSGRTYGARRVWHDVLAAGFNCGLHRIERLMRANALKARPRRRQLPVHDGGRRAGELAGNVLDRNFDAPAPNQEWAADFTYIWTGEGWLYVAVVLDLYSRLVDAGSHALRSRRRRILDGALATGASARAAAPLRSWQPVHE